MNPPIVVFVQDTSKEFDLYKVLAVNILKNETMPISRPSPHQKDYKLADKAFKVCYEMLITGKGELFKERSSIRYIEGLETSIHINSFIKTTLVTSLRQVMKFAYRLMDLGKKFLELHTVSATGHTIPLGAEALIKYLLHTAQFQHKCICNS
jgi:hypothetical protein